MKVPRDIPNDMRMTYIDGYEDGKIDKRRGMIEKMIDRSKKIIDDPRKSKSQKEGCEQLLPSLEAKLAIYNRGYADGKLHRVPLKGGI